MMSDTTESDDVTYLRPEQLADLAQEKMDEAGETGYSVAQDLDVTRSYVYRALRHPSSSYTALYGRILERYGIEADTDHPAYAVHE